MEGADKDVANGSKETGLSKKLKKKLAKIEKSLSLKEKLQLTDFPTKVLCVQNGGLGNDVCQEELMAAFSPHGAVDCVIMLPRKPYAFVCYSDCSSAMKAFQHLNGHTLKQGKDPSQNVILYLLYVERAPPSVVPSSERPPGLHILEDFVTIQEEASLIEHFKFNIEDSEGQKECGVMKHRQVKHFGYEFKYGINDVDINDPLPDGIPTICKGFLDRSLATGLVHFFPDQLTVNQYKPGQGIPPHVDTTYAFEDGIVSLSLGSQAVMDFRHPDGRHLSVVVPRRSLLIMTGDSRYVWSHGITPRKSDIVATPTGCGLTLVHRDTRLSLTFRKVVMDRKEEGKSVIEALLPETEGQAVALEKEHVQQVYDDIAEHFSGTRYKPWPRVVDFLQEQPPLSLLADVGCGNGKCLGVNKDLFEIGSDFSKNLATICRSRGNETCVADVTCLPFRSDSFDVVLCIAVIHHMATKERRQKAVSEIVRVLRAGGRALLYVWAMEQDLQEKPSKYIHVNRQKRIEGSGSPDDEACVVSGDHSRIASSESEESGRVSAGGDGGFVGGTQKMSELPGDVEKKSDRDMGLEERYGSSVGSRKELSDKSCSVSGSVCRGIERCGEEKKESDGSEIVSDCSGLSISERCKDEGVSAGEEKITRKDGSEANLESHDKGRTTGKKLQIHVNRTQFQDQDMLVPWQLKKAAKSCDVSASGSDQQQVFHRYYHMFQQGELEAVCQGVPDCSVRKSYHDQGNWCVVLEKL
ncbi:alkylated DNA repair protein alkB homolog 8 [Aplysia californica]|uniref:tRNA (carboxymethyluridine(34)-5-O)-methyltransferase n=1 Tax=Aplysia californica TaxID=6500 RepID=A0ABM0JZ85_APLCA|nr:alkylated DNA repair protein alkB homolog 8 [Aplysia californica]